MAILERTTRIRGESTFLFVQARHNDQVSLKHLQRYLNEFEYRFNRRKDDGAFMETVRRLAGFAPLTFDALTSEKA